MLIQDEKLVSDASTTRQILTPLSESSLNGSENELSGGKKRKREGDTMDDLLRDSFSVKPYPSGESAKTRNLQPLLLLPRSQLPLSSLDLTSPAALPKSRLFETHVKILELEGRMGSQPMVLIARLDDDRTIYAIEREDRGLYVLCQLGSWVNLHQLKASATVSKQYLPETSERPLEPVMAPLALPLMAPESSKYSKKKRLAIEAIQSMVKRPSIGPLTEHQSSTTSFNSLEESQSNGRVIAGPVLDSNVAQPTASEIFENVRNQYFEALYLSQASLAYFSKGPLSRARAAFHLDYDSTLDMGELIKFLESLVMPTTLIDKKYRDGIPQLVALIDINDHSADEAKQEAEKAKRRRGSKKMKPGKDGLYSMEDVLVRRWWASHDDDTGSGGPGTSREEIAKNRIAQLRVRETQLQMIIILEVLALQPLASASDDVGGVLPAALPASTQDGDEKAAKSKKPDNFPMLIDVHIDRLCIWQSIALEAIKTPADGEPSISTDLPIHADSVLRDFCVEVIVPFFAARLPDRCAAISRKLGGPIVVSPKPKLFKSASFSNTTSRPGQATKRPIPAKPRRSFQRVLTDERERRSVSRGPGRAVSLMRSATAPVVPGLKREGSEAPSLSSIPSVESQLLQANRGGVLNSKRFAQREVDMSSLAPDLKAKAKKQANIEAELKEAISALKKPNRELAGKTIVETAEKRSASASHSRKSKKPIRNPLFQSVQGVQISATPKNNRQKDVYAENRPNSSQMENTDLLTIPTSSLPRIPQSVARQSCGEPTRNPLFPSVQATPTRRPDTDIAQRETRSLGSGVLEHGRCLPSSPLQPRRSSAQLFNAIPESNLRQLPGFMMYTGIQDTPVKKRPDIIPVHSHPDTSHPPCDQENLETAVGDVNDRSKVLSKSNGESIYKSLGWDDADDIDDLA